MPDSVSAVETYRHLEPICMICTKRPADWHEPTPRCAVCRMRERHMWRRFFAGSKWEKRAQHTNPFTND